jgi:hypothetical protein
LENVAENSVVSHCRRVQLETLLESLDRNIAGEFRGENYWVVQLENIAGELSRKTLLKSSIGKHC